MSASAAQEVTVEIAAPPSRCFAVIVDFERYPEWSSAIRRATVLERDQHGVGRVVEFEVDINIKRIRYVLEYAYRRPRQLTWHSVDGDVESVQGAYQFRKLAPQLTEATCRQEVQLGFWLPARIRALAERTALAQSVNEFKAAVERSATPPPRAAQRLRRG